MNQRIEYLDTAKGILIALMVLGHVLLRGIVHQYIYAFHMPAFFIISGILLKHTLSVDRALSDILKKKFFSLIIPFMFFEVLGVLTDIVRGGPTQNIKGYIYNTVSLECNNGPDGFLINLFIAEIGFILICKCIKNETLRVIIPIIIGFMSYSIPNPTLQSFGRGFLFIPIGYHLSKKYIINRNTVLLLISGIIPVAYILIVVLSENWFIRITVFVLSGMAGTYFVIAISRMIEKNHLLKYYGKNSIVILGTHNCFLLPIKYFTGINYFSVYMSAIIFLFIMVMEVPVIYCCNRFVPFLVGKSHSIRFSRFTLKENAFRSGKKL